MSHYIFYEVVPVIGAERAPLIARECGIYGVAALPPRGMPKYEYPKQMRGCAAARGGGDGPLRQHGAFELLTQPTPPDCSCASSGARRKRNVYTHAAAYVNRARPSSRTCTRCSSRETAPWSRSTPSPRPRKDAVRERTGCGRRAPSRPLRCCCRRCCYCCCCCCCCCCVDCLMNRSIFTTSRFLYVSIF